MTANLKKICGKRPVPRVRSKVSMGRAEAIWSGQRTDGAGFFFLLCSSVGPPLPLAEITTEGAPSLRTLQGWVPRTHTSGAFAVAKLGQMRRNEKAISRTRCCRRIVPPLRQAQGSLLHKAQGRGTLGCVSFSSSKGAPPAIHSFVPPAVAKKIWVTSIFNATQKYPAKPHILRLGAASLKGVVRKLRNCLYRGLSSVRISAKAACQHLPRAK